MNEVARLKALLENELKPKIDIAVNNVVANIMLRKETEALKVKKVEQIDVEDIGQLKNKLSVELERCEEVNGKNVSTEGGALLKKRPSPPANCFASNSFFGKMQSGDSCLTLETSGATSKMVSCFCACSCDVRSTVPTTLLKGCEQSSQSAAVCGVKKTGILSCTIDNGVPSGSIVNIVTDSRGVSAPSMAPFSALCQASYNAASSNGAWLGPGSSRMVSPLAPCEAGNFSGNTMPAPVSWGSLDVVVALDPGFEKQWSMEFPSMM